MPPIPARFLTLTIFLTLSNLLRAQTTVPSPTNLLTNPSFESDTAGWSFSGQVAAASAAIDPSVSHTGRKSLRFTNATPYAPNVWYRASRTIVTQPFTTYRISCWVKGESSGDTFIGGGPGWAIRCPFPTGTFDWTRVSIEWSTGPSAEDFELMLLTQATTKSCWVDDVEFTPIRTDTAKLAQLQKNLDANIEKQKHHLADITALAAQHHLSADPYVTLGVSLAQRYLTRIQTLGLQQNMSWSTLQLEEIDTLLNETSHRITDLPPTLPGLSPTPPAPAITLHDGLFFSAPNLPTFFAGYGAFADVFTDLPNFPSYGINLIQDGRRGPSSLTPAGILPDAPSLLADFDRAAQNHIKIDFLLSPHYFPEWAYQQSPDLRNGNIGFIDYNIDHPAARKVMDQWLHAVVPLLKNHPALLSYCLSNEGVYDQSGKDPYSRPKWSAYLRQTHKNIAALNTLYATHYKTFEEVPIPPIIGTPPDQIPAARAYYDWCRFNQLNFADWHRWMHNTIKSLDPNAKTHAKILIPFAFGRDTSHYGVDPELIAEITDIAGCDTVTSPSNVTLTSWQEDEFFYDLLNSFGNHPVFNSETHIIPDGYPALHIPPENTRAVIWQNFLHHLAASTLWIWNEPGPGGLDGSIFLRPANAFSVGRATLDANRLAPELAAINQQRASVALLYSRPSLFWDPSYYPTLRSLYSQLRLAGLKVTFLSERQLAAGKIPDINIIISPHATHVSNQTIQSLATLLTHHRTLLLTSNDDFHFDEYHRPRALPAPFNSLPHIDSTPDAAKNHHDLLSTLRAAGLPCPQLQTAQSQSPATNIEFRFVPYHNSTLIPLINFTPTPQTIRLPNPLPTSATDLLTGQPLNPASIQLNPMIPILLSITTTNNPNP